MNRVMMRGFADRRMSIVAIGIGFLLALGLAGYADTDVAGSVAHEPRGLLETGIALSRFGLSAYMLVLSAILAGAALVVARRTGVASVAQRARRLADRAILFFAAIAVSGLVCQTIKHLVGRARPKLMMQFGAFHFDGPTFRASIDSFPSGHTTTVFAAAVVFSLFKPSWRLGFFALALVVAVARILAGAHFPSDVVAGAGLGSVIAFAVARGFEARGLIEVRCADPQTRRGRASSLETERVPS